MKHITFYFDPISPFAWLAFQRLPEVLMGDDIAPGVSYTVDYKPVLFAALLKHHGQLGPAEIPSKRDWTYRHVQWLGHSLGVPLVMRVAHPFNPLPLLGWHWPARGLRRPGNATAMWPSWCCATCGKVGVTPLHRTVWLRCKTRWLNTWRCAAANWLTPMATP